VIISFFFGGGVIYQYIPVFYWLLNLHGKIPVKILSYYCKSPLARWATKWYDYHAINPTHPTKYLENCYISATADQTKIKKIVEMKTTSNGRRPQNSKRRISQQPLNRSSSNFILKLGGQN
jgi:hypothetical protein